MLMKLIDADNKPMDCLFCKICRKEIGAETIYEDEGNIAILDINPRAPGHTMVVPKNHSETILDVPDNELQPLFSAVKKTTSLLLKALKPDGFTIGINHGKASGQVIDHLHIHIIPRFLDDEGGSIHSVVDNKSGGSVKEVAEKIRRIKNSEL